MKYYYKVTKKYTTWINRCDNPITNNIMPACFCIYRHECIKGHDYVDRGEWAVSPYVIIEGGYKVELITPEEAFAYLL